MKPFCYGKLDKLQISDKSVYLLVLHDRAAPVPSPAGGVMQATIVIDSLDFAPRWTDDVPLRDACASALPGLGCLDGRQFHWQILGLALTSFTVVRRLRHSGLDCVHIPPFLPLLFVLLS